MIKRALLMSGLLFGLGACVSGDGANYYTSSSGGGWNRLSWSGLNLREFRTGLWRVTAAPSGVREGDSGFRLKLSYVSATTRSALIDPEALIPQDQDLLDMAQAAAPEGCKAVGLDAFGDDSFEAIYECDGAENTSI